MSGEAYCPGLELLSLDLTSLELSDSLNWNPLHCLLCQQPLVEPINLPCFHVFCRNCIISRRDRHNRTKCPLCASDWDASDSHLTVDRVVKFFVDSANEKADACANCDQVRQPMYFCETCQQPLCNTCKEQTHQAKMFSTHRLVPHEERSGQTATTKKCKIHDEPCILFTMDTKSLVCITCFRKATPETRPHFADLENAHRSGVEKMEKVAKQLKNFQQDVRDGIILHKSLLEEVRKSANAETAQIQLLCQQMIDRLIEIRDQLLASINRECTDREEHFRRQLGSLCSLVPAIQLHLLMASIFCSSASKVDFLELAYTLIHRIQTLINEHQNTTPSFTAQIQTNYRAEFARALEPFLGMKSVLLPSISNASISRQLSTSSHPQDPVFVVTPVVANMTNAMVGSGGELSPCGSVHSFQYSRGGSSTKRSSHSHFHRLKLMIDLAGAFGDEYSKIDCRLKELLKHFSHISRTAQEVQRDMTLRRCIIDEKRVSELLAECQRLKIDVGVHSTHVDDLHPIFQHIWEEELDRVRVQQETYKNHIGSVLILREDLHHVITASEQLEPFVRSLSQVIQQIKPERCLTDDPCPMQQICLQINTLEPNSQLRVDAIERQEQQRKQEIERKKRESLDVLATAKKQLKAAPKDSQKRKSADVQLLSQTSSSNNSDSGFVNVAGSTSPSTASVVKEVDRNREPSLQMSPGSKTRTCVSPKPPPKKLNDASAAASLDESFEMLLSTIEHGLKHQKKPSIGNACAVSKVQTDVAENTDATVGQTTKIGRSLTLSESVDIQKSDSDENAREEDVLSSSLPSLAALSFSKTECSKMPEAGAAPKFSKLPPTLIATVSQSTLDARERMLASLKEKVPRIDD